MAELPTERLCQICGRVKRIPEEIARSSHATCKTCKVERDRARARWRYYTKVGVPEGWRLCRWCGLPKQIGVDMTPQGRTCRTCRHDRSVKRARVTRRERIDRMTPAEREADRAKMAAKARRQRSTPEGRARHNAAQKAYRQANPEAAAAAQARYRQKVKADPKRAQEWRENQRIYHRIWRERKGMVPHYLSEEEYRNGNGAEFHGGRLPVEPLAELISEWLGDLNGKPLVSQLGVSWQHRDKLTGAGYEQLADLSGVSSRTIREIHTGKRKTIQWATADAVCAVLDTPIGLVYP